MSSRSKSDDQYGYGVCVCEKARRDASLVYWLVMATLEVGVTYHRIDHRDILLA